MSDFLVNVARRGAGLAPLAALRPPFTPAFAPEVGAGRSGKSGTGWALTGRPPPAPPLQAQIEATSPQTPVKALPPQPQPARVMAAPPPAPAPIRLPLLPNSARPEVGAPPSGATHIAGPTKAVETAPLATLEPQVTPPPRHAQPPTSISTPAPVAEPAVQIPVAEHPEPGLDNPPTPKLSSAEKASPLVHPAVIYPALTRETRDIAEVNYPQPIIQSTNQLANHPAIQPTIQPDGQPTIYPTVQPAVAAERPLTLSKPGALPAASPEPRPIQVRIGTIQVRATAPPTPAPSPLPAPAPGGFDNYASIRTYTSWETD